MYNVVLNEKNGDKGSGGNMETGSIKNRMAKDTLLYIPAKALEGIIGIVTLSLYSRFFVPAMYGDYNLAITTVNMTFLLLLGWLSQSVLRYANSFSGQLKAKVFFSTIFRIWGIANIATVVVGLLSLFFIGKISSKVNTSFILLTLCMFLTYSLTNILFTYLGSLRIIKLNLILSVFSATAKLAITTGLVELLHMDIKAAIISFIMVDIVVATIIILRLKLYRHIRLGIFSSCIFRRFSKYGIPLVGVGLTIGLLNVSDRYILRFLDGPSQLGIYTANYSIASAVFSMILLAVMRGVYPMILQTWKKNDKAHTEELLSHAIRYFLLIAAPSAAGLSILSHRVSGILDPEYLPGSGVIIWVSFGMLLLGLTEYCNKAWELTSNTGKIFRNSLISCAFNILANLIFVPLFGYYAAAVNTTLAYLLYFLISYFSGRKILRWRLPTSSLIRILGSCLLMALILFGLARLLPSTAASLVLLVAVGAAVYGASLYLSGEISSEIRQVVNLLRARRKQTN